MKNVPSGIRVPALVRAASLIFISMSCFGQGTFRITFEEPTPQPPGTDYNIQQYFESGMWFRPIGAIEPGVGFGRVGSGDSRDPDNGGSYLRALGGDTLAFSFTDGSIVNLLSVDLAEYGTVVPDAVAVHFIGYRLDGSTVTTDFTTDGIIDGTGSGADFQTFSFGPEFSNLTRVEIPSYGWSLDNLFVTPVPEPGTFALTALGAIAFGIFYKRNRGTED